MAAPVDTPVPGAVTAPAASRLALAGELDLATVPSLAEALEAARAEGGRVDVDASAVTFLDCSALGWLIRTLGLPGVRLVATSRAVDRLATVAGIAPIVAVQVDAATEAAALEAGAGARN